MDDAVYWGDIQFQCDRLKLMRDWSTTAGADANIIKLTRYIGRAKDDYWRRVRIYRVRRLVNAVYTTYGKELKNDLVLKRITRYMRVLDRERDKILSRRGWTERTMFREWDWTKTQAAAAELYRTNPGMFDTLRRNIEGKAYTSPYPNVTRMSTNSNLAKLVRILRDVEFDSGS